MKDLKRIGVLLPQSNAYPKMGKEFLNGLRLATEDLNFEFKIEGIGMANDPKKIIDSIQKLVNQEDVHMLTGLMGHNGLSEILNFVEGLGEKMIYSDLGATEPEDLSARKGIWCNSFDLYNSTMLLGHYFSDLGIKKIGVSTCYYDAGYGFLEAMEKAIAECGISEFAGHFITPLNPRDNEAQLMANFVSNSESEAIFAFHNGVFAKEHASFLKENRVYKNVPLYTLPFSIDEIVLNDFPEVFDNSFCVASWMPSLKSDLNLDFVNQYRDVYRSEPSVFSLLAYENAILINDYLTNKKFTENKFGPRGDLNFEDHSNRTNPKHYLWNLQFENGAYILNSVGELNYKTTSTSQSDKNESGSWHNAYLCH